MARTIKSQYENFNGTDYDIIHYETSEDLLISNVLIVVPASNIYNLNLKDHRSFSITTSGTTEKGINFTNIPFTGGTKITASVLLKYDSSCTITFPNSVKWVDDIAPVFVIGKQYLISFISHDSGNSWLSSVKGPWS